MSFENHKWAHPHQHKVVHLQVSNGRTSCVKRQNVTGRSPLPNSKLRAYLAFKANRVLLSHNTMKEER